MPDHHKLHQIAWLANVAHDDLHLLQLGWPNKKHMSNWIFVNGALGYLGSHICAHLRSKTTHQLMMVDNRKGSFPHITRYGDVIADESFASELMLNAIQEYAPAVVIHCADQSLAQQGLISPLDMWDANAGDMVKLLRACVASGTTRLIFLSTAEAYLSTLGMHSETDQLLPPSAYARTKVAMENMLHDCYVAHGLNSVILRLTSVAGCHPSGDLGPDHSSVSLVPRIMDGIIHGTTMQIHLRHQPTPDGTSLRDYLHVMDLAEAVRLAIDHMDHHPGCHVMNIGSGRATSVQEMVDLAENLFGRRVNYSYGTKPWFEAPSVLVDTTVIENSLGWQATRTTKDIMLDSFKWFNGGIFRSMHD